MPRPQNKILVDQINKRMDDIKSRDSVIGMDNMTMMQLQQNACRELYCEMVAEGLRTTASEILKYVELQPGQKIVETSDNFRIINKAPKEFLDAISNPEIGYPGELPDSNPIHTERCGVCGMNKIIGKSCVSGCITH